jgi:hypothetical protein
MTPEMAFECLLVSSDPSVFCTMHRILTDFSIATNICLSASKAADLLEEGSTDLIVIDWEGEFPIDLLREVSHSRSRQRPTILAVAQNDHSLPGVHVVAQKSMTRESGTISMRTAYTRMVHDFRKHVRYAIMAPVQVTDEHRRTLSVTVTNIGEGGVGLSTRASLSIGDILSFQLRLPETRKDLSIQARVLRTRRYGAAGCEFVCIPKADRRVLLDWIKGRCRIKKPLIDVDLGSWLAN